MNDILCMAIKRAQIPAVREPISLLQQDGKRPDGTILIPWVRGKPMAWDVTVLDTFAKSHLGNTAREPGAAANKALAGKVIKYGALSTTHINFFPVAVKTASTWNELSVKLIQELGRCIAAVNDCL